MHVSFLLTTEVISFCVTRTLDMFNLVFSRDDVSKGTFQFIRVAGGIFNALISSLYEVKKKGPLSQKIH